MQQRQIMRRFTSATCYRKGSQTSELVSGISETQRKGKDSLEIGDGGFCNTNKLINECDTLVWFPRMLAVYRAGRAKQPRVQIQSLPPNSYVTSARPPTPYEAS